MRSEGGMLAGSALALSQLRTHSAHSAVATAAHPDLDRSSPMSRSPAFPSHFVTLVTQVTHCGTARLSSVRPMRCPVHPPQTVGAEERLQHTLRLPLRIYICLRPCCTRPLPCVLLPIASPVPCPLTTSPCRLRGYIRLFLLILRLARPPPFSRRPLRGQVHRHRFGRPACIFSLRSHPPIPSVHLSLSAAFPVQSLFRHTHRRSQGYI